MLLNDFLLSCLEETFYIFIILLFLERDDIINGQKEWLNLVEQCDVTRDHFHR